MKTPTEQHSDGKTVLCTIVHRAVKVISQITVYVHIDKFPVPKSSLVSICPIFT